MLLVLSACSPLIAMRQTKADHVAARHGFSKNLVCGGQFMFTTYQKINAPDKPTTVYIEGDGSIAAGGHPTSNPTPRNPMVLFLAALDPRPNVVYIARPCQYTPPELNPHCHSAYWIEKRWALEVVLAMNEAINKISAAEKIDLVGFSGGGGIAALVAAINPKIQSIITIAGNLDIVSFNNYHSAKQLPESLNPLDVARRIRHIPQLHLSGDRDTQVPAIIADKFVKASNSPCVQQMILRKVSHNSGWDEYWPKILAIPLVCKNQ